MNANPDKTQPAVAYKRLDHDVPAPHRAHHGDAGTDLTFQRLIGDNGNYLHPDRITIMPGETARIGTGIAVAIPHGYVGVLNVRSSTGTKKRLTLANGTGYIDAGYRGEVIAMLQNNSRCAQTLDRGDRVVQMLVVPVLTDTWQESELDDTARGTGGFGSTGI